MFFSFTLVNYGHEGRRGEYPLIRVFIQQRVTGFHLHERPIDLKFLIKSFHQLVKPAGQIPLQNPSIFLYLALNGTPAPIFL